VCSELRLLAGTGGPRVEAVFGGVSIGRQAQALRRGVEIVVACPGRLGDLINQRMIFLNEVDVVVLDEADRMADMGFLPEVRKLLDQCPDDRRTILFSATLDGDVDILVKRYQHDPVRHELDVPEEDAPDVDHHFWAVDRGDRVAVTANLIDRMGPTVVFCRTKHGADRVAKQLSTAGVTAVAIHGDRSQAQRDRALDQFRSGRADALVATDVAARGIHVDAVAAVVHFDPPPDYKDYVHRSGRTGRAGARGVVVTMVVADVRSAVKSLQRSLDLPIGVDPVNIDALAEPGARLSTSPPSNRATRTAAKDEERDDRPSSNRGERPQRTGERRPARRKPSDGARSRSDRPRSEGDRPESPGPRRTDGSGRPKKPRHARSGSGGGSGAPSSGARRPSGSSRPKRSS